MNKRLFVILAVVVALSVLSSTVVARSSERTLPARGVWCYMPDLGTATEIPNPYKPPDKSFLSVAYDSVWTGTFAGSSKDTGLLVAHGVWPAAEPMSLVGTVWFEAAEVDGASGGLEMDAIGDRPDTTSEWRGTWVITGGTGDLEGIQGRGTWWGPGWLGDPEACGVIYYKGNVRLN